MKANANVNRIIIWGFSSKRNEWNVKHHFNQILKNRLKFIELNLNLIEKVHAVGLVALKLSELVYKIVDASIVLSDE